MDTRMDRRSFLKNAALAGAALLAAPAVLGAVEPQAALADDYTCTCDVYVAQSDHGFAQVKGNAYLTNPTTPKNLLTGPFPNYSVADNATIDDDMVVTVNLVNTMFKLTSINSTSNDGGATIVDSTFEDGRYTQLKIQVSSTDVDYVFTATEHAGILSMSKSWPIHVLVTM